MKTIVQIIAIVVIAMLLALWSPWANWDLSLAGLFGYRKPEGFAGLQISSIAGEMEVYVDNELQGTVTPDNSPLHLVTLQPGERSIRLHRLSDPEGFYAEDFNNLIHLAEGIDTIISYEVGPTIKYSEGHVLSALKDESDQTVRLTISTNPTNSTIFLNDIELTENIIESLDLSRQHKIKVTADSYETLEFVLLPDSQADRDKLINYDLTLNVNLLSIPINTISE